MARDENMIAALKRERATYVAAGDEDRVRQVDESLAHYGYEPQASEDDGPQGRTQAPRQTADRGRTAAKKAAEKKAAPAAPPAPPAPAGDQPQSPTTE
ncbi:hypothetical protein GFH48_19100 [Streptomyces fagopyri]|uniref:Uncharacterized protein n=1 Tax=Streptomyces fagopyri TaxID=2662397 RepID=A0A5Q0LDE7_9ACTN|nr:hypothetical protein [Streptomyces fagopyri]QFZ75095.1 hypothetical protein GFH48_19100 [Streptomyces fagopyri]